jgi:serine/threonine-protein kinase RsbW
VADTLTIELLSTRDAMASASAEAEAWLESHHPSPQALNFLLIAVEELVLNCIDYGYDDDAVHTITIVLSIEDQRLTLTVIDDGHPFDPLARPSPDLSRPVKDRPAGGLGIYLLQKLSDQISYERRDGTNRLTLTKGLQ